MVRKLPLFDGFIETPFERRFQGLLRQAWQQRSWHVIVAEPGPAKQWALATSEMRLHARPEWLEDGGIPCWQ